MPSAPESAAVSTGLGKFAVFVRKYIIRIAVAALIIAGGAGLLLHNQPQAAQSCVLFNGKQFSSTELGVIEAAFAKSNLGEYKIVNRTVEVPHSQKGAYISALAQANALPQEFGRTLEKTAVDISLFDSPEVRNLKIKAAQQKDLADIINSIEGVSCATVLWDTEKKGGLNPQNIVRASISFKSVDNKELDEAQIESIRLLTANAVAGLKPENVVIIDTRTGLCYSSPVLEPGKENTFSDSPERIKDPALYKRLTAEKFWNKKISDLLAVSVEGATVQTTVELSDCQSETERRIIHDSEPTIYKSEILEDVSPAAFGINQPESLESPLPQIRQTSNVSASQTAAPSTIIRKTEEGVLGGSEIVTQKCPLSEKSVRVSIVIPFNHLISIWLNSESRLPGQKPTAEELSQIELSQRASIIQTIANILPQQAAEQKPENYIHITFSGLNKSARLIAAAELGAPQATGNIPSESPNPEAVPVQSAASNSVLKPAVADNSNPLSETSNTAQADAAPSWGESVKSNLLYAFGYIKSVIEQNPQVSVLAGFAFALFLTVLLLIRRIFRRSRETVKPAPQDVCSEKSTPSPAEALLEEAEQNTPEDTLVSQNEAKTEVKPEPVKLELHTEQIQPAETAPQDGVYSPEFAFLESVSALKLAQTLSVERPQISALILAQIPESRAAETLGLFSPEYRTQTIERLLHFENPEANIIADAAEAFQEQLNSFSEENVNPDNLCSSENAGMSKISKILSVSGVSLGQEILGSVKQADKTVLEPIYPSGVTFEDLPQMDVGSIKNLLSAADPNEVALSLVGAQKELISQLLAPLPETEQQMYRSQLWLIGPTKLSDVEEARRRLVQLTKDLAVQGKVKLADRFYPQSSVPFSPLKMRA